MGNFSGSNKLCKVVLGIHSEANVLFEKLGGAQLWRTYVFCPIHMGVGQWHAGRAFGTWAVMHPRRLPAWQAAIPAIVNDSQAQHRYVFIYIFRRTLWRVAIIVLFTKRLYLNKALTCSTCRINSYFFMDADHHSDSARIAPFFFLSGVRGFILFYFQSRIFACNVCSIFL